MSERLLGQWWGPAVTNIIGIAQRLVQDHNVLNRIVKEEPSRVVKQ